MFVIAIAIPEMNSALTTPDFMENQPPNNVNTIVVIHPILLSKLQYQILKIPFRRKIYGHRPKNASPILNKNMNPIINRLMVNPFF